MTMTATNGEPKRQKREPTTLDRQRLLYTETAAADLLSISPRLLKELRQDGKVKFVRIGKHDVRYAYEALQEWRDNNLTLATPKGNTDGDTDHQ